MFSSFFLIRNLFSLSARKEVSHAFDSSQPLITGPRYRLPNKNVPFLAKFDDANDMLY